MVTTSETLDQNGHTLIRAKEELTDKHITLLKMWGISEIDVKYSKDEIDIELLKTEFSPIDVNNATLEADTRFKHFDNESKISFLLKKYYILDKLKGAEK